MVAGCAFLIVSLKSVATVGACAGVGVYARKKGLISDAVEEGLDKLIAGLFLPCLILQKVTPNMKPTELVKIWPLVAMCLFVVLYGLISGALVSRCLQSCYPRAFPKFTGLLMVAVAFPNSFSVPLTLMLALGDHPALIPPGFRRGDALSERINMLFLTSYSVWVLARWSIGFPIMSGAITFAKWRVKVLNPPVVACIVGAAAGLAWCFCPESMRPGEAWVPFFQPFATALAYAGRCTVPVILIQLGVRLSAAVSEVFTHLQVPKLDAEPLLSSEEFCHACSSGTLSDVLPVPAYLAVLMLRQVIGPILGAGIAIGLLRDRCGVTDPVVLMVGMLQAAGPPMINLSVMAGLAGSAQKETAKLVLVTYFASIVTWTASIGFFLFLLS